MLADSQAVHDRGLHLAIEKMRDAAMPDAALKEFAYFYDRLRSGATGMLPEAGLEPVNDVADLGDLQDDDAAAQRALRHTIVLKLNGGLGTSMGLRRPKSLLEVKDGLTFLEMIIRQILTIRRLAAARVPLLLMNSFATDGDTAVALERHPELATDVADSFVQSSFPRLNPDALEPVTWPKDPTLEWAPPGHGDLYVSIAASGMLTQLLKHDYRYAFISNSDNLGATLEQRILAWFIRAEIPFLMEVAERTEADRKGGHLARLRGDGLVLRESAQTAPGDVSAFQDVTRYRFFNTNNLWLNLEALARTVASGDGILRLPLIVNRKSVDPSDPRSPEVIQLESAMGAAIGAFEGAQALRVPRHRFAPVKTTDDLLAVRSDAYVMGEDGHLELAPERGNHPVVVELDPRFFKLLPDFEARFPAGPPSLIGCDRLRVLGDVLFGRHVVIRGSVTIAATGHQQLQIEDGAVIEG